MSSYLTSVRMRIRLVFWFLYSFFAHRLRRAGSADLLFLKNFEEDGIVSMSFGDRSLIPSAQRCIGCGLCVTDCPAIREGVAPWGFDPSQIVIQLARASMDSEVLGDGNIPCLACDKCTVLCPTRVPIHTIATIVVERSKRFLMKL